MLKGASRGAARERREPGGRDKSEALPPRPRDLERALDAYHLHDARQLSVLIGSNQAINSTITSPPYWDLKDYEVDSQIGFGQKYDSYLDDLVGVFKAVFAATKSDGSLWIVSDTIKHNGSLRLLPFDLARRLQDVGWILQDIIIWNKDKTLPWSHQGKLRNIFEYVTFFSKTKNFKFHLKQVRDVEQLREWWVRYPERYSPDGKAPARAWYFPIPRQGSWGKNWVRHFNPLPPLLIERILLLTTDPGDIVLDPFAGSGAVLAQAHVMGRRYVGTDLSPTYQTMFRDRVLPALEAFSKSSAKIEIPAARRRAFRAMILRLRRTKYPKEALRAYQKAFQRPSVDAILALQEARSNVLHVAFLFRNPDKAPKEFLERVEGLSKKPPLSKYGIEARFSIRSTRALAWRNFEGTRIDKKRLFVYEEGRTYTWTRTTKVSGVSRTLASIKESNDKSKKFPPIISNVGVKIDPKKPFPEAGDK